VLPPVLRRFADRFPKVKLELHQGNPVQVAEQTVRGDADVGIATEALALFPELVTLPCYQWNRCVLVPRGHPLAAVRPLTLKALARYPIVTYDYTFTGRSQINAAFDAEGLAPNVVLTALDSDVIKTYVELGMGRHRGADGPHPTRVQKVDASHLFAPPPRVAAPRGFPAWLYLRIYPPRTGARSRTVDAALTGAEKPDSRRERFMLCLMSPWCASAGRRSQGGAADAAHGRLSINGHKITAEVAATPERRATGLMHRVRLRPDHGMVFVSERAEPQAFWMKNTYIPLSIAFIAPNGRIINIADMAPEDENLHWSKGPALYALEMRKGWFAERGIQDGDAVKGLPEPKR
jgi:uncharacterized membrane protein (UPF0127 family)